MKMKWYILFCPCRKRKYLKINISSRRQNFKGFLFRDLNTAGIDTFMYEAACCSRNIPLSLDAGHLRLSLGKTCIFSTLTLFLRKIHFQKVWFSGNLRAFTEFSQKKLALTLDYCHSGFITLRLMLRSLRNPVNMGIFGLLCFVWFHHVIFI